MKVNKSGRLRWLGHLFGMQEHNPCRKLTLHKPEGTRRVGRPAVRWLDSIEEDIKIMGVRNWRRKTQDRDRWRAIVEETKVHMNCASYFYKTLGAAEWWVELVLVVLQVVL
jgi:hypothetical protein